MLRFVVFAVVLLGVCGCANADAAPVAELTSPDGRIRVSVEAGEAGAFYRVDFRGEPLVARSRLGLMFKAVYGFDRNLEIAEVETAERDTTWEQPWGERRTVRDHHREMAVTLRATEGPKRSLIVRFRAFDDGIGFRYELGEQSGIDAVEIIDELTEFALPQDYQSWSIPARGWNRYEYLYDTGPSSDVHSAHTPITFKAPSGAHLSIHEAALVNYAGMSLIQKRPNTFKAHLAPWSDGVLVRTKAPFVTPWRTLQIGDAATDLLNSSLILNLNEPNALGDVSWVEPGKYVGIWWAMHIRDRSWGNDTIHGATTSETIRYMDFAAKYGFKGVLVEGWNIGWDGDWYNNGALFDFTRPYDDFDIAAIAAHGRKVGVRLIGHHETSGDVSNYEAQLEDALDFYATHDVAQIKTGYVADGGRIERIDDHGIRKYEWHDGQFMVDHHLRVVTEAAKRQISINPHEPVKDTGLRRTYPNWIAREGARGSEYDAWGIPPNPPEHTAILPYTRMLSGPMDYTPGIFDLRPNERPPLRADMPRNDPRSRLETTLAKQLALYVVLYSPIQMVADLPENYEARPEAFQFIVDVPTDWEESIAVAGEIGDYVAFARKERGGDDWYLGALTDEDARSLTLDLDFLDGGQNYEAQIYRDGEGAHFDTNPYPLVVETRLVRQGDALTLDLAPGGGTAIRFKAVSVLPAVAGK